MTETQQSHVKHPDYRAPTVQSWEAGCGFNADVLHLTPGCNQVLKAPSEFDLLEFDLNIYKWPLIFINFLLVYTVFIALPLVVCILFLIYLPTVRHPWFTEDGRLCRRQEHLEVPWCGEEGRRWTSWPELDSVTLNPAHFLWWHSQLLLPPPHASSLVLCLNEMQNKLWLVLLDVSAWWGIFNWRLRDGCL